MSKKIIWIVVVFVVLDLIGAFLYFNNRIDQSQTQLLTMDESAQIIQNFDSNNFDAAISQTNDILAKDPNNVGALLLLGSIYTQKGSINLQESEYSQKAMEVAQKVLSINPNSAEAYRIMGYANEMVQKYDDAIDAYTKALSLNPKSPADIYYHRGHAYDLKGDLTNARSDYNKSVAIDSTNLQADLNLARLYWRDLRVADAEKLFSLVASSSSNVRLKAESYFDLSSVALYGKNDKEASLSYALKAIESDPNYAQAHVGAARIYTLKSDYKNASVELSKAENLNPKLSLAAEWEGMAHFKTADYGPAVIAFEHAKDLAAQDITIMDNEKKGTSARLDYDIAISYAATNDTDYAIESLQSALTNQDALTFALIQQSVQDGSKGYFKNLIGDSRYDQIAQMFKGQSSNKQSLISKIFAYLLPEKVNAATAVPAISATCTATPNEATIGDDPATVTWSVSPTGGNGTYTYVWQGDGIAKGTATQNVTVNYATPGQKISRVVIKSGGKTLTTKWCSASLTNGGGKVIDLHPHGTGAEAVTLDGTLTALLSKFANGKINSVTLRRACQAIITQASDGGANCVFSQFANGSMALGCSNADAALYVPNLQVSCSANTSLAAPGDQITWTAHASGGNAYSADTYDFKWQGSDAEFNASPDLQQNEQTSPSLVQLAYNQSGVKTASVTVTTNNVKYFTRHPNKGQSRTQPDQTKTVQCINSVTVSPNNTTCPDGSTRQADGTCPNENNLCPDGSVKPANGICSNTDNLCPDGSAPVNGVCSNTDNLCPDGSVKPANGVCSNTNNLCPDGSVKPANGVCSNGNKVTIDNFKANPILINKADSCNLIYDVSNATACSITGINAGGANINTYTIPMSGNGASGQHATDPLISTQKYIYTLTCHNKTDTETAQAFCQINPQFNEH